MQEHQAETITQLPESILPHGNLPLPTIQGGKVVCFFSLSISILSTFFFFLNGQIYWAPSIHNNTATTTTTTHQSYFHRNNNHRWLFSSGISCRQSNDCLLNYKLFKWNEMSWNMKYIWNQMKHWRYKLLNSFQYFIWCVGKKAKNTLHLHTEVML